MIVKLHSKIKHKIVGYYFGIFQKMFKNTKTPPYSWYYVDLFSGDGSCSVDIKEHITKFLPLDEKKEWLPPFFQLFEYAAQSNFPLSCYFNDKEVDKVKALRIVLKPYANFIKACDVEDANIWYKKVISMIKGPNKPGMFFLDPTNHVQLKFSTIEGIAQFKHPKTGRMPELIINLMTFTMLKAIERGKEKDLQSITDSLGTDEWKKDLLIYKRKGKTHELFRDVFLAQLNKLGYHTTWYSVKSKVNAPQYYIVIATYKNAQVNSIQERMEPYIKELQNKEWVKKIYEVDLLNKRIEAGQQTLTASLGKVNILP